MPTAGFLRLNLLLAQAHASPKMNHLTGNAMHILEVRRLDLNTPNMNGLDLLSGYVHQASSLGMNPTHDL